MRTSFSNFKLFLSISLLPLLLCFALHPSFSHSLLETESNRFEATNATETDVSGSPLVEGSFADMIDRALEKEFTENDQTEAATDAGSFNNSVSKQQLDLRLISDLVVVIVSATCGGIAFACAGQPVMTGYLLAGSVVGPGGLNLVSEMVQVETVAQFGVIFLLFALGLEFSTSKLRVVQAVAVLGGLIQIILFMCLCGIIALLCGGNPSEGVFIGAYLSMSSTAVVLKFLMERNSTNALHGQVTIGTLILQDCAVGLLFALLPVLGGTSSVLEGVISMIKLPMNSINWHRWHSVYS